ncbi:hypothetical protein DL93DRAFT_2155185 [Clavulina sp. PMI_390]|nr:hypothetical protein DL93DRAFT_2155185 [Clavulina sp. PMI_390]
MNDLTEEHQLREREYAASLAAYSLLGLVHARSQQFNADEQQYPGSTSSQLGDEPPVILERSKIRSPLERRAEAAPIPDPRTRVVSDLTMSRQGPNPPIAGGTAPMQPHVHPRRMGRNGTPHPSDAQCSKPLVAPSTSNVSSASSVSKDVGAARTLNCAEPTFSLGLPRGGWTRTLASMNLLEVITASAIQPGH